MKYTVELKPRAIKDLKSIPKTDARRIVERLKLLEENLQGDVRKLTKHTPEYRCRAGNWRVLFEIESEKIIVYRILQRKVAYR